MFARNAAILQWCLRKASKARAAGRYEDAAEWSHLAAFSASNAGWHGDLLCRDLEQQLYDLSRHLPRANCNSRNGHQRRCLHVMTTAFEIGGHSNMLARWIAALGEQGQHNLILTDQTGRVPEKLRQTVLKHGGECLVLASGISEFAKAKQLREVAADRGDFVILHIHPYDVAAVLAFGFSWPTPVCFMNHADHVFGVGTSVADLIIEFRDLGAEWTRLYRGAERSVVLPLPLENHAVRDWNSTARRDARSRLDVSPGEVVLLTVGTAYKYRPVKAWNFVAAGSDILERCPEAVLFAVGPDLSNDWVPAAARFGRRLRVIGSGLDVSGGASDFHAAADIALGTFPFASQTAMLESAALGIPCVPTPRAIPFGFDDRAFEGLPWPVTQQEYVDQTIFLIRNPDDRRRTGTQLSQSIKRFHGGEEWRQQYKSMLARIPASHHYYEPSPTRALPDETREFWATFTRLVEADPVRNIHGRIIGRSSGVYPMPDRELARAIGLKASKALGDQLQFAVWKARFKLGKVRRTLAKV